MAEFLCRLLSARGESSLMGTQWKGNMIMDAVWASLRRDGRKIWTPFASWEEAARRIFTEGKGSLMGVTAESADAIAYVIGNGPDVINVRRSDLTRDGQAWQYSIHQDGALVVAGNDLGSPEDKLPRDALVSLAAFLGADAEKYQRLMGRPVPEGEDGYLFGEKVAEWAYQHDDELSLISELGE